MNASDVVSHSDAAMLLNLMTGWEEKMSSSRDATERAGLARSKLRWILFLTAIVGFGLTIAAQFSPLNWLDLIIREFGSALIVAAVIGGTVDFFFKQEFARDAFVAAFRYVMPDELKAEVLRVISYKFLSIDSRLIVKLEPISGTELLRVHIRAERVIKNISHHTESFDVAMAVDEWGFDGHKSIVDECSFNIGQGAESCPDEEHSDSVIGNRTNGVEVKSGETIRIIMKGSEVHRQNSALRLFHMYPAINPSVELHFPKNLDCERSFGVPGEKVQRSSIDFNRRLDGTQFPGQCTHIRWSPRGTAI
jgi:hypothetical protein